MDYQSFNDQNNPQKNNERSSMTMAIIQNVRQVIVTAQQPNVSNNQGGYKKPGFTVIDMPSTFIDMNKSFEYVGDNSTFQKRITTILVIQWIAFSFMVSGMAYFFRSPSFQCKIPLTDIFISCPQNTACKYLGSNNIRISFQSGLFLHYNQKSIIQDFQLYCSGEDLAPLAQSLFFFGGLISGFLLSYISGLIGRRSTLLILLFVSATSMATCALTNSFQLFLVAYFLSGFGLFGYETSVYIYIGQISASRFRSISINMLTMVFVGTPLFLPFLSFIPTWRYAFLFFVTLLAATFPLALKFFLESPRFLQSKKCYKQAQEIFNKISMTNKRPPYQFRLIDQIEAQNQTYVRFQAHEPNKLQTDILSQQQQRSYNFISLFRYPSIKKPTLILMYFWLFRFFMYSGLNLALQSVLKSGLLLLITISIGAFMEVLGTFGTSIMTTFLYNTYKLNVIKLSFCVISVCTLLMYFLQIEPDCKLIPVFQEDRICPSMIFLILLFLVVKFFNSAFFSALIVYYAQVFPTPVRSLGCGFTLTFGRFGTTIVPFYINYMKINYRNVNPFTIAAPLSFIALYLCSMLPITQKEGMKDRITEQVQEQNKQNMIELSSRDSRSPSKKYQKVQSSQSQQLNKPLLQKHKCNTQQL